MHICVYGCYMKMKNQIVLMLHMHIYTYIHIYTKQIRIIFDGQFHVFLTDFPYQTGTKPVESRVVKLIIVTRILIIIEGQSQVFQRFFSSKLVLNTVTNHFAALNYYQNGNSTLTFSFLGLQSFFFVFFTKEKRLLFMNMRVGYIYIYIYIYICIMYIYTYKHTYS